MESKVFFEKNVVRVNKLISHLMVLSLIVVPILAVLRFFGIYSVSYKYIIVLFLMDLGITSCQVIMVHTKVNPAFVKHYTLWSLCVFVCAMGSSRHLGIYVLFSIVPFLSCLYMDVKLTITANIINCFSTFTALYFRAL